LRFRQVFMSFVISALAVVSFAVVSAVASSATAGQCASVSGLTMSGNIGDAGGATLDAGAGSVVSAVCVKAGSNNTGGPYYFALVGGDVTQVSPINGTVPAGCYTITGLGTRESTVTGGGTSQDCKTISHVVFYTDSTSNPTPTPTPTPTGGGSAPSPSPSPTPTPTSNPPSDPPGQTSPPVNDPAPPVTGVDGSVFSSRSK